MKIKIFENVLYISLALMLIGQIVIGGNYIWGQILYLVANTINLARTFAMKRPLADKVKDSCCFAVTLGLIILWVI